MKDELTIKVEKLCKFYANRYGKTGHKIDRLRMRIMRSYLDDIDARLLDFNTDVAICQHEASQNNE